MNTRKKIEQLGKRYAPLGRILNENSDKEWEEVLQIAVVALMENIKDLSDLVVEERKKRKTES